MLNRMVKVRKRVSKTKYTKAHFYPMQIIFINALTILSLFADVFTRIFHNPDRL
jgi:hypothetical protein